MPPLRTLLAAPVSLVLLSLSPTSSSVPAAPATDTLLPVLVTQGKAPAAALLAREDSGTRYARADRFRAGSITKTFIATVVLQLAAEHRLSELDPRVAGAAGELVITLADLDRFYAALAGRRTAALAPAARDARHPHHTRPVRHGPVSREAASRHHGVGTQDASPAATCAPQPPPTAVMSSPSA